MTDSPIFAQIPFELACRFGELSKNEIRVFVYLLARRNANSEQCNPRPVLIADELKMDKGNVSKAISGLEEKNWIIWQKNGHFLFPVLGEKLLNLQLSTPEKVGSSTTLDAGKLVVLQLSTDEKLLNQQPKVGSSTTQVVKSTTLLNKDLEQTNNRQIEQESEYEDTTAKKPHTPETENSVESFSQKPRFGNASEITDEVFGEPFTEKTEDNLFFEKCVDGMKIRLNTPVKLKNEREWVKVFEFWKINQSTAENLLQIFDLKNEIRTRKNETWQIVPKVLENAFGTLEALRMELEALGNTRNGVKNAAIQPNKLSNTDIITNRDYSKFDGFNPVEAFAER